MGAGDLAAFVAAGRTLLSLGLVTGTEGNLSTFDGARLFITRTGCELGRLTDADVLEGTLVEPPGQASSDLLLHLEAYRANGPGAVAHAHPPGSVREGWTEGEPHGVYVPRATLAGAVAEIVRAARGIES